MDVLELHEFFVEGGDTERSHVLLHITEPSTPEERKKGYFFAIAEINNGNIEQIEHLQQMIDDLESGYYETEEDENDEKTSFEVTLEYVNRRGHHILQNENSLINCLVGVLRGHELFFAYHGSPNAILFYKNKIGELKQMDILEGQETLEQDQLFSSMLQGNINAGDYFYVSTPHVIDYFTHDRVKKIASSRTTRQAVGHIQKVLSDLKNEMSFGGLMIHFPTKEEIPKTGKQPKTLIKDPTDSISKMIEAERKTAETLSPSLIQNLKKKIKGTREQQTEKKQKNKLQRIQNKRKKNIEKTTLSETNYRVREEKESLTNVILVGLGRSIVTGISSLFKLIKKILFLTGKLILILFLLTTNKGNQREAVIKEIKQFKENKKEKWTETPLLTKILLISTIIFALIFISSLTFVKIKESNEAQKQAYENQIQAILDKKNAADASLIYDDDKKAFTLLQEAKNLISNLSDNSKEKQDKIQELNAEIESTLTKLRKIINIDPEILLDLTQTDPEANTNNLIKIDEQIIAYGNDKASIYIINQNNKNVEVKNHSTIPHLFKGSTPKENDKIVFISGDKSIAEYDKETGTISDKEIDFPNENVKLSDLFVYNRKLYSLDSNNGKIYKHTQTQTGYDKGTSWLEDETDIKNGNSISIDGDLFVLTQDDLIKLANGEKAEFSIQGLDPKLDNPTTLWTYSDLNYLYILEPTNKRVIILDKKGKLINQYTNTNWQNPTGMVVEENEKTIYVLDSNKIYKFNF